MKQRFFLLGTLLGLFGGIPLVGYLLGGKGLFGLLLVPSFAAPIGAAYLTALSLARAIDLGHPSGRPGFLRVVGFLELVYLSGALVGCLSNWALNGRFFSSNGLGEEFFTWVVKPGFWLLAVGIPCALAVALVAVLLDRILRR